MHFRRKLTLSNPYCCRGSCFHVHVFQLCIDPEIPGWPLGPSTPGNPWDPLSPLDPSTPCSPGAPVNPFLPENPLGPRVPGKPMGRENNKKKFTGIS